MWFEQCMFNICATLLSLNFLPILHFPFFLLTKPSNFVHGAYKKSYKVNLSHLFHLNVWLLILWFYHRCIVDILKWLFNDIQQNQFCWNLLAFSPLSYHQSSLRFHGNKLSRTSSRLSTYICVFKPQNIRYKCCVTYEQILWQFPVKNIKKIF